jgi:hypothetical protein
MKLFGYEFIVRKADLSAPPPKRSLSLLLYDKWLGRGQEYQVKFGFYSEGQYFTTNGKHIPLSHVMKWSLD